MKAHRIAWQIALPLGGCLYTGDGTQGLPCRTDTECGGAQLCVESVCGGPIVGSESSSGGESSSDDGTAGEGVRDRCEPADTQCLDATVLQLCTKDGKLSTRDCAGWCGQASPSNGCFTQPDGTGTCYCEDEREACNNGDAWDYRCFGNNLRQCDGDYWNPLDCDRLCVEVGYGGGERCGPGESSDTCFCNTGCYEGATRCVPCTEGATRCADQATVAQCIGGEWMSYDCNDLCVENGKSFSPGCDFFNSEDDESCGCV